MASLLLDSTRRCHSDKKRGKNYFRIFFEKSTAPKVLEPALQTAPLTRSNETRPVEREFWAI